MQRDEQGHWVGSLEDLAHTLTETLAKMTDAEKAELRREIPDQTTEDAGQNEVVQ